MNNENETVTFIYLLKVGVICPKFSQIFMSRDTSVNKLIRELCSQIIPKYITYIPKMHDPKMQILYIYRNVDQKGNNNYFRVKSFLFSSLCLSS